jgi:hypothetical protein
MGPMQEWVRQQGRAIQPCTRSGCLARWSLLFLCCNPPLRPPLPPPPHTQTHPFHSLFPVSHTLLHQPALPHQALLKEVRARGAAVPEVSWATPGEAAAAAALAGPQGFLSPQRLGLYDTKRNDPGVPQVSHCCC